MAENMVHINTRPPCACLWPRNKQERDLAPVHSAKPWSYRTETSTGIHEVDKRLLPELSISFLMHYGFAFVVLRKAR